MKTIKEAVILAGGLGTRLRSVVADLPKCMAPVAGKPFLWYVINYLQSQQIEQFIFSLGYKHEAITQFLISDFPSLSFHAVIEDKPLGTGGAIKKAIETAAGSSIFITNGDTLFKSNLRQLENLHFSSDADCSLSLKPMNNFDRYGVVEIDEQNIIQSFKEKKIYESGLINGGLYALNKQKFLHENLPEKFSFEKDYLEKLYRERKMTGIVQDEYFIDIGIPEDYSKAQKDLQKH